MNPALWTAYRAAGGLLLGSLLIGLLALVIMVASGTMPGFAAPLQSALANLAPA